MTHCETCHSVPRPSFVSFSSAQRCHTVGGGGLYAENPPLSFIASFFFPFFSFSRNSLQLQTHTQSPHVAASLVNHNQQFSRENRRKATVWVPAGGIGLGRRGTSRLKGRRTGKCHKQRLLDESARRSRRNISGGYKCHVAVAFRRRFPC